MAELDAELAALGVEEDDDFRALGVEEDTPTPRPESIAPEPYGPHDTRALRPSALGAIADVGREIGILPSERTARGAVASAVQGPTANWADELLGVLNQRDALTKAMVDRSGPVDLDRAYEEGRGAFRSAEEKFRAENPGLALGLQMAGGLAMPTGPQGTFGTRATGAAASGVFAGAGASDEADDMFLSAVVGAPLGVAGQAVGELVGTGVGWATSLLGKGARRIGQGVVQPSQAAQTLQRAGVKDLTIGQMAPKSFLAQLEEAGTSIGGIGHQIKGQRDAGMRGVQQAALREGLPPGVADVPNSRNLGTTIGAIDAAFDDAYSAAHGHQVDPDTIRQALNAVDDSSIYADDALRSKVSKWLGNQMTALRLSDEGKVLSDDVIRLRSDVRALSRSTKNPEERSLLKAAEIELTDALNASMPEDVQRALAATDIQYAKHRTVADAVWSAGDQPDGFTTKQFSSAVRDNTPRRIYERGGGGPLRELSEATEETVGAKIPLTGARWLSVGPVPYVTGPMSYLANLPGPKRALLGQMPWQQRLLASGVPQAFADEGAEAGMLAGGALGASDARASGPTSQGDMVEHMAQANRAALGPYADTIQKAAAAGTLALVHWNLQQTDPNYRAMLEALRKEQQ